MKVLKYFGEEDWMLKYVLKVRKQNLSLPPPETRMVSLVFNSEKFLFAYILIKNSMVAACQPWVFLFSNPNVEKDKK